MAGSPLCPLENAHWVAGDKGPLGTWLLGSGARSVRVWEQFRVDHVCADPQLGLGLSQLWGGVPDPKGPRSSVSRSEGSVSAGEAWNSFDSRISSADKWGPR